MKRPPTLTAPGAAIFVGDCIDVLTEMPDSSVDAIVTDPPYGLEFMGKDWDSFKSGRAAAYANGGAITETDFKSLGALPSYVRRPAKRCAECGKQAWSGSPCTCPEPRWVMDNSPLHAFQDWATAWTVECFRVLKPGGHILAFGGSRTWHRLACAVEDAGFEIRDSIAWLYGSGFPKSLDVSKAIDKQDAAAERLSRAREFQAWLSGHLTAQQVNAATGTAMGHHLTTHPTQPSVATADIFDLLRPLLPEIPARIEALVAQRTVESANYAARAVTGVTRNAPAGWDMDGGTTYADRDITRPHTPEAAAWQGWGTALKPAFEPIVVGRKPLVGTVAANVLAHGTGALNIDGCRVHSVDAVEGRSRHGGGIVGNGSSYEMPDSHGGMPAGRWPANVLLDGSQADALDAQSGTTRSSRPSASVDYGSRAPADQDNAVYGRGLATATPNVAPYGDAGGASRYFPTFRYQAKAPTSERPKVDGVAHPTVKPLALMQWLIRLVTPPGGTILDPFAGSGATIEAALLEGVHVLGIERETDYLPLISARLSRVADATPRHHKQQLTSPDMPFLFDVTEPTMRGA